MPGTTLYCIGSLSERITGLNASDTTALWNANELQGKNISAISPATGQVLQWTGCVWVPTTLPVGWNITGNAGINPAANFLGTTDTNALRFRVDNQWAGELNPAAGNTSYGVHAGQAVTTGSLNTATGSGSLSSNSTGYQNTATGSGSLSSNTTGYNNTATGAYSLYYNTTGFSNTATGKGSLNGNTTGYNNTAVGDYSLYFNTTGYNNTAAGTSSLDTNTTGYNNTSTGFESLRFNTTGNNNTADVIKVFILIPQVIAM